LKAWLKKREPYDWILSLSSRPKHLLAFAILASAKRYSQTRFLLLFVLSPGQRDIAGNFRLSASNLFAKFCFALLRSAVQRGQAVIAAETEGMQEEIERFSGLPVKLFPHPVVMPEAAESPMAYRGGLIAERPLAAGGEQIADGREDTLYAGRSALDSKAPATSYPQPATSTKPLLVVAPGLARYEKGSNFMQTAIRLLLQKAETLKSEKLKEACSAPKDRRSEIGDRGLRESLNLVPSSATTGGRTVKFLMQWPEDFDLPDGRRCAPDSDLLKDERVKFSKDLLTGNAYWDFLQQADVIVLPYRSESYRARVSRVAIEAAILGKPMVYTKDTWINEVVEMGGAGVAIAEETPQSLAEAIQMAIGGLNTLQSEAERGMARVREFYSVSAFHRLLGEVGGNKKSNIAE
jgi:hypothetical protein